MFGWPTGRQKILHRMIANTPWLQSALNFFMNGILIPFWRTNNKIQLKSILSQQIPKYYSGVSFVSKFSLSISSDHFTEYGESLSCSEEPGTYPCPEPDKSSAGPPQDLVWISLLLNFITCRMQILWWQQNILATYPCKLPTCHSAMNAEVLGQFNNTSVNTASILQCRQKEGKWRQLVTRSEYKRFKENDLSTAQE